MSVIYTVTVYGSPAAGETQIAVRMCGYYLSKEAAVRVIENNECDISALNNFQYALLAETEEGNPLPGARQLQWYEFLWDGAEFCGVKKLRKLPPPLTRGRWQVQ